MRHCLSILFLLLGLSGTAAAGGADIITLNGQASVSRERLLLGDIATVQGPHAPEFAKLPLGKVPGTGPGITLSAHFVASRVMEKFPGASVSMEGAPRVHVSREREKISGEEIEALFRNAVLKSSPYKGRGGIEINDVRTPSSLSVPVGDKGRLQAKFSPAEDFLGLVTATISAAGSTSEICRVSGRIRVMAQVPVAARPIPRGALITEADLELRACDLSASPLMVTDLKDCLGMRAKTALRAGKPLLRPNIAVPPLVSRGDLVAMEARTENLVIVDRGIALKDGCLGEKIPVRNAASGKQVIGTIIAHSQVEVTF